MSQEDNRRIDAVLESAVARLAAVSDSAKLDAEVLLCRSIDMPRSYLFAHPEDVLDEAAYRRFDTLVRRRL
ncbi:MAG: protein-(glutamine-N5) methyltransferase, release factor-specific, partial [Gammaproteobacteria bacterium]|nr:protein-(glutamine-N5) methyltransferase, release factor-specific [Gammaproteobacteria bacterium]